MDQNLDEIDQDDPPSDAECERGHKVNQVRSGLPDSAQKAWGGPTRGDDYDTTFLAHDEQREEPEPPEHRRREEVGSVPILSNASFSCIGVAAERLRRRREEDLKGSPWRVGEKSGEDSKEDRDNDATPSSTSSSEARQR